jgi:hypothetical protein
MLINNVSLVTLNIDFLEVKLDKKVALSVLGLAFLAIAILMLIPTGKPPSKHLLPWSAKALHNGSSVVFGLTLGQSTMQDAGKIFEDDWEVVLFVSPKGSISVEGYFNRLIISGLKGDFVMNLALDQKTKEGIFQRGTRISKLGDGTKKVSLSSSDMDTIANAIIQQITYLPSANLEGKLVENLFGKPESIVKVAKSGIEHWLYPEIGLDILLDPNGREVFQYVMPSRFDAVKQPLLEIEKQVEE